MTHREVTTWTRSSHSGGGANGANCVEAGTINCDDVTIRDSKLSAAELIPTLTVDSTNWASFLLEVKHGRYDCQDN